MIALETAAKAMYARNAAAASGRLPWDKATDMVKAHMVELARAAFESVPVPTDGMIQVGMEFDYHNIEYLWHAMIDAALQEKAQ